MVSSELGNKFFPKVSESKIRGKVRCEFIVYLLSAVHQKILRRHWLNSADIGQLLKSFLGIKKCPGLKSFWCWALDTLNDCIKAPGHVIRGWWRSGIGMLSAPLCCGTSDSSAAPLTAGWEQARGSYRALAGGLQEVVDQCRCCFLWLSSHTLSTSPGWRHLIRKETPCRGDLAAVGEPAKRLPAVTWFSWMELTFGRGDTKQTSRSGSKAQWSQQRFFPHLRTWALKYLCTC